jgi:hypothetical protein
MDDDELTARLRAVTGKDGNGQPTPTVRELIAILQAIPGQFQDLPVARYTDEGVAGISFALHYYREDDPEHWTKHVQLW